MSTAFLFFGYLERPELTLTQTFTYKHLKLITSGQGIHSVSTSTSPQLQTGEQVLPSQPRPWKETWTDRYCGVGSRQYSGLGQLGIQTDRQYIQLVRFEQLTTFTDSSWWHSYCDHSPHCGVGSRPSKTGQGSGSQFFVQGVGSHHFFTGLILKLCALQYRDITNTQQTATRTLTIGSQEILPVSAILTSTPYTGGGSLLQHSGPGCTIQLAIHGTASASFWNISNFWIPFLNIPGALVTHCGFGPRHNLPGHCDTCPILVQWYNPNIVQQQEAATDTIILPTLRLFECYSNTGICATHLSSGCLHPELNWCFADTQISLADIGQSFNRVYRRLLLALLALGYVGLFIYNFFFGQQHWHNFALLNCVDRQYRTFLLSWTALPVPTTCALTQKRGEPGPKSRDRPTKSRSSLARIFHCVSVFMLPHVLTEWPIRGEGCAPVMGGVEVPLTPQPTLLSTGGTKQHDTRPETGDHAINWHPKQTKVAKRSIKRAFARACAQGLAWYKGRCYTPQDFPKNLPMPVTSPATKLQKDGNPAIKACNRKHRDARRLSFLNWNTGGLNSAKLDEIKIWLEDQQIDAAVLTETRMPFEAEWSDDKWLHVHTGTPADKGGGVFCLVSRRICTAQQLKWQPIVEGRLLHVQLQLKHRNVDIVGCYQHTQCHTTRRRTERQTWWTQLD